MKRQTKNNTAPIQTNNVYMYIREPSPYYKARKMLGKDYSIDNQKIQITNYCAQNNLNITHIFEDKYNKEDTLADQSELNKLMSLLKKGINVICYSLYLITNNQESLEYINRKIQQMKCTLIFLDIEPVRPVDIVGNAIMSILAATHYLDNEQYNNYKPSALEINFKKIYKL